MLRRIIYIILLPRGQHTTLNDIVDIYLLLCVCVEE